MTIKHPLFFLAAGLALAACHSGPPPVRVDVETVTPAPSAPSPLGYTLPAGWQDRGPSGMRLATLVTASGNEVSIALLPGTGGDLEGNLARWLGQLGLRPGPDALSRFAQTLRGERLGGGELLVADLGAFVADGASPSMQVALWRLPEGLVTLKMTGPKTRLGADAPAFSSLARSLKLKDAP